VSARSLLRILALLACVALVGCLSSSPDKRVLQYLNTDGFGKRYTGNAEEENWVTIGDQVTFADTYFIELRGTARVDIDGTIMVPEAGPVAVAGLSRSEIEGLLTQKLSPYYAETDIKVVIAAQTKVFYVVGEVAVPGARPFPGDLTILEAVLAAGPPKYTANLGRVQLIRADPRDPLIIEVDITELLKTGDSSFNIHVQELDILYIPPTILKQVADFISSLIVPFTSTLASVIQSIFLVNALNNGVYFGAGKFGGAGGKGIF
jgi:protein involved in polysaccharide export with SLBB domain